MIRLFPLAVSLAIALSFSAGCVPQREPSFLEVKEQALTDEASPEGRAYKLELGQRLGALQSSLVRCLEAHRGLIGMEIVLVIDGSGLASSGFVSPVTPFSECLLGEIQESLLPEPPFAPFYAYISIGTQTSVVPSEEEGPTDQGDQGEEAGAPETGP